MQFYGFGWLLTSPDCEPAERPAELELVRCEDLVSLLQYLVRRDGMYVNLAARLGEGGISCLARRSNRASGRDV